MEAAQKPPVIIVGHGAQHIFRDRPGTVQVRLVADIESRIPRIVARDGGTEHDAAVRARRMDAQRQAYVQRYYHHFWADPMLFDVQFNTGRVAISEAVAVVAGLVDGRGAGSESARAG